MTSTSASSDKSPQLSVAMSHSLSQSASSASQQQPFPTPASTTGVLLSANIDSDGDAMMDDGADDDVSRIADGRRSDHNRQQRSAYSKEGRSRATEGIFGSQLFKVSKEPIEKSRPHGSQNLFKLYSLETLASSVARTNPVTGEKINKLRKSYEGHIKALQIAGKPKATKMERVFEDMLMAPPDDWHNLHVGGGRELPRALNAEQTALNPDFGRLLDGAFAGMGPGPLPQPESTKYKTYIGTDDAVVKAKPQDGPPHRPSPYTSAASASATPALYRGGPARPERAGAKRHYTDTSFQGYGEGYGDEYADSTGGEDNGQGNMAKRRKLQFERTSHSVEVGGARR